MQRSLGDRNYRVIGAVSEAEQSQTEVGVTQNCTRGALQCGVLFRKGVPFLGGFIVCRERTMETPLNLSLDSAITESPRFKAGHSQQTLTPATAADTASLSPQSQFSVNDAPFRMPTPSPSRPRLSRRYAARLSSWSERDEDLLPPTVSRKSSFFQPKPILGLDASPGRKQFPSDHGVSDRFIPSRATSSAYHKLWTNESFSYSSRADEDAPVGESNSISTATAGTSSQQHQLLSSLLRSELLGENEHRSNHSNPNPAQSSGSGPLQPVNRLRYAGTRHFYQSSVFHSGTSSVVNSFDLTPTRYTNENHLMTGPAKRKRRINRVPFKVLDAPNLQDDFYLNLVDWSSQNVLAVALGPSVYLWSACTSKVTRLCDLSENEDTVTSVSWAQRGGHLAVGTNRGESQIWDTTKCECIRVTSNHTARIGSMAWCGPMLASGGRDRLIHLQDLRTNSDFTNKLSNHKQEVCGLKWSFDEPAFLASGGNDNHLHVIDSRNPSMPLHKFEEHTAAVKAIAWSPHQHGLLASGGGTADRCIRFWNALTGAHLNKVDTGSQVCNLAWSQNCNEMVSTHGYSLNQIIVWRYPKMSKVATLTGHSYRVLYLAMSPDGSTVVTGAGDETLRFWQIFPGPRSDGKDGTGGLLYPNTLGSVIR